MTYNAINVAKDIITYCRSKNIEVSNLKLQKLLYYAWVGYYRQTGKYLFKNRIYAWQLGPVVPTVYDTFCAYASLPITRNFPLYCENEDLEIIKSSLADYIDKTSSELVKMTHRPGTPWYEVFDGGAGLRREIPFEKIIELECNK